MLRGWIHTVTGGLHLTDGAIPYSVESGKCRLSRRRLKNIYGNKPRTNVASATRPTASM